MLTEKEEKAVSLALSTETVKVTEFDWVLFALQDITMNKIGNEGIWQIFISHNIAYDYKGLLMISW